MTHRIIFRKRTPNGLEEEDECQSVLTMLEKMLSTLSRSAPIEWSGPEDGSYSGHLQCKRGVELIIHLMNGGLHFDICVIPDATFCIDGGMIGTIVDNRQHPAVFNNLTAAKAKSLALSMIKGWIAEIKQAEIGGPHYLPKDLAEAGQKVAHSFMALSLNSGQIEGDHMMGGIVHPTPYGNASFLGLDQNFRRQWTVDEGTIKGLENLLPQASVIEIDTVRPMIVKIMGLDQWPDVQIPIHPMDVLRSLSELKLDHKVDLIFPENI